jgi:hypothetical protein
MSIETLWGHARSRCPGAPHGGVGTERVRQDIDRPPGSWRASSKPCAGQRVTKIFQEWISTRVKVRPELE